MPGYSGLTNEVATWLQELLGGQEYEDPIPAYRFWVEVNGIMAGAFTECSGLDGERVIDTIVEGGVNDHVHMLPGPMKFQDIQLKRGMTFSRDLWDWYVDGVENGLMKPHKVSVLLFDRGGKVAQRWDFPNLFPVKWEGPTFNTGSAELAIETLVLGRQGSSSGGGGGGSDGGGGIKSGGKADGEKAEEGDSGTIARAAINSSATGDSEEDITSASATSASVAKNGNTPEEEEIDLNQLTGKVYKLFKNDVRVELERLGMRG